MSEDPATDVVARIHEIASTLDGFADGVQTGGSPDPETLDRAIGQLRQLRNRSFGRAPAWHRSVVGGEGALWDRNADQQYDFMLRAGLKPQHFLLDIGCGSLRMGTRFIPYLDAGHYFGVDRNQRLIEAGLAEEISPEVRAAKQPELVVMADFAFEQLGRRFDFAIAPYLFQDLPLNAIMRCLVNVGRVLEPGGRFYATVFENVDKRNLEPVQRGAGQSFYDAAPYHYDLETLACLCRGTGLLLDDTTGEGHPGGQRMLLFTRDSDSATEERSG